MGIIISAVVALLTQFIKMNYSKNEWQTLSVVLVLSLVAAFAYTYLVAAGYWQTFMSILITAGAIYTFIIARFE